MSTTRGNKRNQGGQLTVGNILTGEQTTMETMSCNHCGDIVVLNPQRTRARSWCWKCDQYICDKPGCNAECVSVDEATEKAMSGAPGGPHLLRSPEGYNVTRLHLPDGSEKLIKRRHIGP